jgi:hypothetical protein
LSKATCLAFPVSVSVVIILNSFPAENNFSDEGILFTVKKTCEVVYVSRRVVAEVRGPFGSGPQLSLA